MSKRSFVVALAVLLAVVALGCGDDDGGSSFTPAAAPAGPEVGPLIAGASSYQDGTFVWTDYAYDDRGPNKDAAEGGDRTQSAFAGGDAAYPDAAAPGNAADLIQLQIGLHRGALFVWAILETMVDPALPVVGVAFDTDADPATGAPSLPGGRWQTDGSLGVEVLVEISAAHARLWTYSGGVWNAGEPFASVVDSAANLLGTTVPPDLLRPGSGVWRVAAAVGIAGSGGSWLDGAEDIYDLAFVGGEPNVRWQDNLQSDILAGALDAAAAVAEVDLGRVRGGETTAAAPLAPGFHTFLYHSPLRLAEGIAYDQNASPIFLGPYQPYLVYVPEVLPHPTPLSVFLHGSDQNHLGAVFQQPGDFYIGTGRALSEDPHLIATLGFAGDGFDFPPHMLQVYPLARGARLGYRGIAHQDVLDVLADTMSRFDVDPDRVILQGASMGGIGTYRLATLQPDRWSIALPLIGFQSPNLLPLSVNLLNLPVRQINGGADPLIDEAPASASAARLDELEYDYRYWLLFDRGHEAGGYVYDCVFVDALDFVRERHPARVLYSVDPSLDEVDTDSGLDLRFDGAYWVDAIRARDGARAATVDATSLALPRTPVEARHIDRVVDNTDQGADLCGLDPDIRTGDRWRERGVELIAGVELPVRDEIELLTDNVASLDLAVGDAGLDLAVDSLVRATTDGPLSLTLRGLRRGTRVRGGGVEVGSGEDGSATIDLPAGATDVAIEP